MPTIIIRYIHGLICIALAIWMMTGHVADGNTYSIYIDNGKLHIGDFWNWAIIMHLLYTAVQKFKFRRGRDAKNRN